MMKFFLKRGTWRKRSDNRRQYMRQASFIVAEYTVQEGTYQDVIKNLSAGGLYIETKRKVRVGQPIILDFPLFKFKKIIEAHAKIVRANNKGFAVNFLNPINDLICEDGQFPDIVHEVDRAFE